MHTTWILRCKTLAARTTPATPFSTVRPRRTALATCDGPLSEAPSRSSRSATPESSRGRDVLLVFLRERDAAHHCETNEDRTEQSAALLAALLGVARFETVTGPCWCDEGEAGISDPNFEHVAECKAARAVLASRRCARTEGCGGAGLRMDEDGREMYCPCPAGNDLRRRDDGA